MSGGISNFPNNGFLQARRISVFGRLSEYVDQDLACDRDEGRSVKYQSQLAPYYYH